jgi:hypothetical protein
MKDYYSRGARSSFPPPRVNNDDANPFITSLAVFIALMFGIALIAGVMWLGLWAVDLESLFSLGQLLGLAGAYVLFRLVDKALFGLKK